MATKYIIADNAYWLRDAVNSSTYAMVSISGYALHAVVNSKQFFRPVFGIVGGE